MCGRRISLPLPQGRGIASAFFARSDPLRHSDKALCLFEVKQFGHLALHPDSALVGVLRVGEGIDHGLGPAYFIFARREYLVAGPDLIGMDQGLAVKPKQQPFKKAFVGMTEF